jgi:hypothetical protein
MDSIMSDCDSIVTIHGSTWYRVGLISSKPEIDAHLYLVHCMENSKKKLYLYETFF